MGNSPGWTQGSFGNVRDVSWLVWDNHELQVWLNWHWGRDGSLGMASPKPRGCLCSSLPLSSRNSAFPSWKSSGECPRCSWSSVGWQHDPLARDLLPGCSTWCWDQLTWVWSLLVLGTPMECVGQHPGIHQQGHFPAESQAPRRSLRSLGGGGDEFALLVPF